MTRDQLRGPGCGHLVTRAIMTHLPILLGVLLSSSLGQKCPDAKVKLSQFHKWTETVKEAGKVRPVADAPCWFDLTR